MALAGLRTPRASGGRRFAQAIRSPGCGRDGIQRDVIGRLVLQPTRGAIRRAAAFRSESHGHAGSSAMDPSGGPRRASRQLQFTREISPL
jgi:hypothetical protein